MTLFTTSQFISLLTGIASILKRHREVALARQDSFNIFEILRLQSDEQRLHSRFIAHLLNPSGSHEMGSLFLDSFLSIVAIKFDSASAKVSTELFVGRVDHKAKTGGSIDIYLEDKYGQGISIENKIYAIDQKNQLERYWNYRNGKNQVIYLTLNNSNEDESTRNVADFDDYLPISYSEEIMTWLEECHRISVDHPTLRETIKQYRNTVAQLTNQMNDQEQNELKAMILRNFEAASQVASNFDKIRLEIAGRLRDAVYTRLSDQVGEKFHVSKGHDIKTRFAQIWIEYRHNDELLKHVFLGIEPFNRGHTHPELFIGVFDAEEEKENGFSQLNDLNRYNAYWSNIRKFSAFENEDVKMTNARLIGMIGSDQNKFDALATMITTEALDYLAEIEGALEQYAELKYRRSNSK